MAVVSPKHWFLPARDVPRTPHFTTANSVTALIDGKSYMEDLLATLRACDGFAHISGWRVCSDQILDPKDGGGKISGTAFIDALESVLKRKGAVRALVFDVPGSELPGPFRKWHADNNRRFCEDLRKRGGEALLDSRFSRKPASSHHQKFVVTHSSKPAGCAAYVGGIDVCYDRWDTPAHDNAAERQRDFVTAGAVTLHTPSLPGWHDVQAKVQGPAVSQVADVFQDRWNDKRAANNNPLLTDFRLAPPLDKAPPAPEVSGTQAVQVLLTMPEGLFPRDGGPGEQSIEKGHARAIDLAQHYIYIEDQYFWPCSLVDNLEAALKRGVHVVAVVARDYDAPGLAVVHQEMRRSVAERLTAAAPDRFKIFHIERADGEQIYVHSKVLIVDDCYASIGSANFNWRSLTNDTELQLAIVDSETLPVRIGRSPQTVCRFAHDLRLALWQEHLGASPAELADPIEAIRGIWSRAPLTTFPRVVPHSVRPGPLDADAIAELLTTVIMEGMADVPALAAIEVSLPQPEVKAAVKAAVLGPIAPRLLAFIEDLLNPCLSHRYRRHLQHYKVWPLLDAIIPAALRLPDRKQERDTSIGQQIVRRLRRRELPQMVDWFDPNLLARIGVRSVISSTIGQYADQRILQAASDRVQSEEELASRYDFSLLHGPDPKKRLETDENGGIWVDYIADLGDGFEATYAMASLMAPDRLEVAGAGRGDAPVTLPAGQVLVMGGDQCYPQGTVQEYQARLVDPYDWAFPSERSTRKLFAIPGNHDWYDGLVAFDSLFCSARDRISGGIGRKIGGWRCQQHRSYFAIKLPYGWWIWAPDIQLEGNLDDSQRDYFDIMSEKTTAGDRIVLCLAEPSWLHQDYDNLHEITMLARKHGADVVAVLAGDWHHYSRYEAPDLHVQLITSGGGGAFAHASHQLKTRLDLQWPEVTTSTRRVADPADTLGFNRMEQSVVKPGEAIDFTERTHEVSVYDEDPNGSHGARKEHRGGHREPPSFKLFEAHAPRIYPSRLKSRLLCLKNLWLPLHNRKFALLIGLIYFLFAWVFYVATPKDTSGAQALTQLASEAQAARQIAEINAQEASRLEERARRATGAGPGGQDDKTRMTAEANLAKQKAEAQNKVADALDARVKAISDQSHRKQLEGVNPKDTTAVKQALWPIVSEYIGAQKVFNAAVNSPIFFFMLLGLWAGLVYYVELSPRLPRFIATPIRLVIGTAHFLAHLATLLMVSLIGFLGTLAAAMIPMALQYMMSGADLAGKLNPGLIQEATIMVMYFILSTLLGGLVGGFIFGLYWVLMSSIAALHCGDAFGALGIRHYKHFLRMRFEPERLTIYPIALDKVPGRKQWRAPKPEETLHPNAPLIVPTRPLRPHLIEDPIVIEARPRNATGFRNGRKTKIAYDCQASGKRERETEPA